MTANSSSSSSSRQHTLHCNLGSSLKATGSRELDISTARSEILKIIKNILCSHQKGNGMALFSYIIIITSIVQITSIVGFVKNNEMSSKFSRVSLIPVKVDTFITAAMRMAQKQQ